MHFEVVNEAQVYHSLHRLTLDAGEGNTAVVTIVAMSLSGFGIWIITDYRQRSGKK